MARREFNPIDVFLHLRPKVQNAGALRSVLFEPGTDMYETPDALVLKMDLAGVEPENLSITLSADARYLTIAGERRERETERRDCIRSYQLEIFFGNFERTLQLPETVRIDRNRMTAQYRDGFLVITLSKRTEIPPEGRRIPLS